MLLLAHLWSIIAWPKPEQLTWVAPSIKSKKVTYDFARLMEGATQVSCSGFCQVMIDHM